MLKKTRRELDRKMESRELDDAMETWEIPCEEEEIQLGLKYARMLCVSLF